MNDKIKSIRRTAVEYINEFSHIRGTGKSLILCGKPGTGKTHLSCAIGLALIRQGYWVQYSTEYWAIKRIKATWDKDSETTEGEVLRKFRRLDLLIIDEVGVSFDTNAERVLLYQIVNGRYEDLKPTIFIANLTEEEMKERIGERTIDRLKERGGVTMAFDWGSYRK